MTSSSPAGRRIRVLFTGSREASNWEPWGREMLTELSRSHDVTVAAPDRPLVDQVADPAIEVVVDASMLASPELAAAAEGHVRLWQLGSVGYDKVDVRSLARHGIPTANQPGFTSSRSLAEQALMLAMMVASMSALWVAAKWPEHRQIVVALLAPEPMKLELLRLSSTFS